MNNLIINVNFDNAYKLIKDNIYCCITEPVDFQNRIFHHNEKIDVIPNILQYGLLCNELRIKLLEKRDLTEKEKDMYLDECYVNGKSYVSLSSMDEDFSQMYRDEMYWDPYDTIESDIVISGEIEALRKTTNYFNEYLVYNKVPVEMFNSIDVKLLRINDYVFFDKNLNNKENRANLMLEHYEYLRQIAFIIKQNNLNIALREISYVKNEKEKDKALTLDVDKVIELPKLILKK